MTIHRDMSEALLLQGAITQATIDAASWDSDTEKDPAFVQEIIKFLDGDYRSAYWWGPCGTGKTHQARGVLNDAMSRGTGVCEVSGVSLAIGLRRFEGHKLERIISTARVLLIDDIGQANWDARSIEGLWAILNERGDRNLKTIITCNDDTKWLRAKLTEGSNSGCAESIIQRLHPIQVLHFEGESLR